MRGFTHALTRFIHPNLNQPRFCNSVPRDEVLKHWLFTATDCNGKILNMVTAPSIKQHWLALLKLHYAYGCSLDQFHLRWLQGQEEREPGRLSYSENVFNNQRRAGHTRVALAGSTYSQGRPSSCKLLSVTCAKENSNKKERKQNIKNIEGEATVARNCIVTCMFYGKNVGCLKARPDVPICCQVTLTSKEQAQQRDTAGFYRGSYLAWTGMLQILFTFLPV